MLIFSGMLREINDRFADKGGRRCVTPEIRSVSIDRDGGGRFRGGNKRATDTAPPGPATTSPVMIARGAAGAVPEKLQRKKFIKMKRPGA